MNRIRETRPLTAIGIICAFFATVQIAAEPSVAGSVGLVHSWPVLGGESQVQSLKSKVTGQLQRIIDLLLLAGAQTTQWTNGNVRLPFPGEETDSRGFACYRENMELEDGKIYSKILETHPEWRNEHGLIVGIFKIAKLPSKATFKAQVGFLKGAAQTDGVKFRVYTKKDPSFSATNWCYYDGKLDDIGIFLDRYAGEDVELVLEAHVIHTSAQDWAVWLSPRIEWE